MKKSIQIISLILVLIINKSFAQSNYQDYTNKDKQNIFYDDFSNNKNKWIEKNESDGKYSIENGYYVIQSKINKSKTINKTIIIDSSNDFEIETSIKIVNDNDPDDAHSLCWGLKSLNKFQFGYTQNKEYIITKYDNNRPSGRKHIFISNFTFFSSINRNGYNKLTIRKVSNYYYFFINEKFAYKMPFENFYGNKIGFKNSSFSTMSIDYLTVNYLEKPKKTVDKTPPEITIIYPDVSNGFKPVEQNKQITIQGNAKDASGIFEILVNGQEAYIDAQGNFTKNVLLAVGDNSFTVTATDIKQNTSTKTFTIERKVQQEETIIENNNQTNTTVVLETGKYYALIIGNNSYQDNVISSLSEPINDATKLYNVLTTKYTFAPQNVTLLKDAAYVQMIEAFDDLSNTLTKNDNLLVFYAGHGWWDEDKNLGYWLPADARYNSTAFWIRNSTISDYMGSIKSKHTLLIADACFSGSIFKTRSAFNDVQPAIYKLYELPSKTAMTSGNLKEVPDKSVFLQYLVKRLNDNTEKYISADILFASFRIAVMNNSATEPQFGTIQNAGDEGGEFIFIRK